MTTKIAYLEAGPLLDYWVAMAAEYDPVCQPDSADGPRVCISKCHDQGELVPVTPRTFRPSTSWGDGGPLIKREHIDLVSGFGYWIASHGMRGLPPGRRILTMRADLIQAWGAKSHVGLGVCANCLS